MRELSQLHEYRHAKLYWEHIVIFNFISTQGGNRYNYVILQFCYLTVRDLRVRFFVSVFRWGRLVWASIAFSYATLLRSIIHWLSWAGHLIFILAHKGKLVHVHVNANWNDAASTNQRSDVGLLNSRSSSQSCLRKVLSHFSSLFYAHSNDAQKRLELN